jgi:hypothetical protein
VDLEVEIIDGDDLAVLLPYVVEGDRRHTTDLLRPAERGPLHPPPREGELDGPRTRHPVGLG